MHISRVVADIRGLTLNNALSQTVRVNRGDALNLDGLFFGRDDREDTVRREEIGAAVPN